MILLAYPRFSEWWDAMIGFYTGNRASGCGLTVAFSHNGDNTIESSLSPDERFEIKKSSSHYFSQARPINSLFGRFHSFLKPKSETNPPTTFHLVSSRHPSKVTKRARVKPTAVFYCKNDSLVDTSKSPGYNCQIYHPASCCWSRHTF